MRDQHRWNPTCEPPRGLVRPVRVDPSGLRGPTRGQAAGTRWRATSHGCYVPEPTDSTVPEQRILEASMRLPPGGAVTGWAALRLHRGGFFDGLLPDGRTLRPVPLVSGPGQSRRRQDGIAWMEDRLDPADVVVRHGIRCTVAERALFDEMRKATDVREAAVAVDMAAAAEITSILRMRAYVADRSGTEGVEQVRTALGLADENSRSPNETRMRLIWVLDAKLPRPRVNVTLHNRSGRFLGTVDLLDEAAGVVGEFDGADHRRASRHSADVDREGRCRDHDLEFFRVTGPDIAVRERVVARMLSTRGRAKWLPPGERPWVVLADDAPSLDAILDERDLLRDLHRQWERDIRNIRDGRSS